MKESYAGKKVQRGRAEEFARQRPVMRGPFCFQFIISQKRELEMAECYGFSFAICVC
jgi:hypothetical protein